MHNNTAVSLIVEDGSQVGEARRAAAALGVESGLGEVERGNLAIVVTEAGNNLVRHAGGGRIVLQPVSQGNLCWIDVLALDTGPGMRSVANALRDGHSTGGTAGQGLGAIARLSASFDVFSAPDQGTVLFARLPAASALPMKRFDFGALSLPYPGEEVCGDAWAVDTEGPGPARFLVADGLGHGPAAGEASAGLALVFGEARGRGPAGTLEAAHAALRHTRGAAAAIASVDGGTVTFAGVGNIQAALVTPGAEEGVRGLSSYNGTVGHQAHKFADFTYERDDDAVLVMASDGLTTQWRLDRYPGLLHRHPAVIAGVLYRDHCRGRDDATVLVASPLAEENRRGGRA